MYCFFSFGQNKKENSYELSLSLSVNNTLSISNASAEILNNFKEQGIENTNFSFYFANGTISNNEEKSFLKIDSLHTFKTINHKTVFEKNFENIELSQKNNDFRLNNELNDCTPYFEIISSNYNFNNLKINDTISVSKFITVPNTFFGNYSIPLKQIIKLTSSDNKIAVYSIENTLSEDVNIEDFKVNVNGSGKIIYQLDIDKIIYFDSSIEVSTTLIKNEYQVNGLDFIKINYIKTP